MNGMPSGQSGRSNRKLMWGLAIVVGAGLVIAALRSGTGLLSFLPFLLILACPLMMIFMMGSMNHSSGSEHDHTAMSVDTPNMKGLTRDQQVRVLRGEMTKLAWRQEALRQDLEHLESDRVVDAEPTATTR